MQHARFVDAAAEHVGVGHERVGIVPDQMLQYYIGGRWASYLCQRDKVTISQGNRYVHCCDSLAGMIGWHRDAIWTAPCFQAAQEREERDAHESKGRMERGDAHHESHPPPPSPNMCSKQYF